MKLLFLFSSFALLFSSCVYYSPLAKRYFVPINHNSNLASFPDTGIEAKTEIGQSMIFTARKYEVPAIRINEQIVHSGVNLEIPYTLTIQPGVLRSIATDNEGTFYQAGEKISFKARGGETFFWGGVYINSDSGGSTEVYWLAPDNGIPLNDTRPGIKFEVFTDEMFGKESFKKELVYTGISATTVSIMYREYIDDFARPAFSQALQYDLSQGNEIGFMGARFLVLDANNLNIRYKVLKHIE